MTFPSGIRRLSGANLASRNSALFDGSWRPSDT
jgi:hypothetical protein